MLLEPFRYFINKGFIRIRALKLSPPLDNQPVSLKIIGAIPNIDRFSAPTLHCALDFS